MKHIATLFFVFLFPLCVFAQDVFEWNNPSFEDIRRPGHLPNSWSDLYPGNSYSPVDVQPGCFACVKPPIHGNSYISMVVREDGTKEGVLQSFVEPFLKDSTYTFSVWVCRSPTFYSPTKNSGGRAISFVKPLKLQVVGLDQEDLKQEVLFESVAISDTVWEKLDIVFKPKNNDYFALSLSVISDKDRVNGHLLLDNLSPVVRLPNYWASNTSVTLQEKRNFVLNKVNKEIELFCPVFSESVANVDNCWTLVSIIDVGISQFITADNGFRWGSQSLTLKAQKSGERAGARQSLSGILAQSAVYEFRVTIGGKMPNKRKMIGDPLRLFVWGGTALSPKQELLAQSSPVDHEEAKYYDFILNPQKGSWDTILLEAFYVSGTKVSYNGSLTLYGCSTIKRTR